MRTRGTPHDDLRGKALSAGFAAAARSHIGLVRTRLEDAWRVDLEARLANSPFAVAAVFDGLGGLPGGLEAAAAAARTLEEAMRDATGPESVLPRLNRAVATTGGHTTAVVVLLPVQPPPPATGVTSAAIPSTRAAGALLSVGDSAAYMLDARGRARLLNTKDSLGPNVVSDHLGHNGMRGHAAPFDLPPGKSLLLCTDGVDGVVDEASLVRVLQAPEPHLADALDALIDEILDLGAPDNATAVLVRRRA